MVLLQNRKCTSSFVLKVTHKGCDLNHEQLRKFKENDLMQLNLIFLLRRITARGIYTIYNINMYWFKTTIHVIKLYKELDKKFEISRY